MRKLWKLSGLLAGLFLGSTVVGCASVGADDMTIGDDDDPALADIDSLKMDAPTDSTIQFEGKSDTVLPKSYDIVHLQTPVKSQGSRGVCSIFATTSLAEMLYKKAGMKDPDFSEQYVQWSVKNQVGAYKNTSGSSDSYNLMAFSSFGVPLESAWPYETTQWGELNDAACKGTENLPTKCYTNGEPPTSATSATKYKLPNGRWVSTRSIKNVIFEKKQGVVVGMDFFYQSWNHRRSELPVNASYWNKGYVLYPNSTDKTKSRVKRAGHSVQIVGWDDNLEVPKVDANGQPVLTSTGKPSVDRGFFIFKNSWGTGGFGIEHPKGPGYGYISYKYVNEFGSGNTADAPRL